MKIIKKISKVFFVLTLMFLLNIATNAEAAETLTPPDNFGKPIEVNTYEEDDGSIVTEKIYFVPDESSDGISLYSSSVSGWYKNEKEHNWGSGIVMKYYAQGHFTWGNGTVDVSNPSGDIINIPSSVTIPSRTIRPDKGKYIDNYGMSRDFALVKFSFTAKMNIGIDKDFSVSIKVNDIGQKL